MLKLFFLLFTLSSRSVLGTYKYSKLNVDSNSADKNRILSMREVEANENSLLEETRVDINDRDNLLFGELDSKDDGNFDDGQLDSSVENDADNVPLTDGNSSMVAVPVTNTDEPPRESLYLSELEDFVVAHNLDKLGFSLPYLDKVPLIVLLKLFQYQQESNTFLLLPPEIIIKISEYLGPIHGATWLLSLKLVNKTFKKLMDFNTNRVILTLCKEGKLWRVKSSAMRRHLLRQVLRGRGPWIKNVPYKWLWQYHEMFKTEYGSEYDMLPVKDCLECKPQRYMFDTYSNNSCFTFFFGYPQVCFSLSALLLIAVFFSIPIHYLLVHAELGLGLAFSIAFVCVLPCFLKTLDRNCSELKIR